MIESNELEGLTAAENRICEGWQYDMIESSGDPVYDPLDLCAGYRMRHSFRLHSINVGECSERAFVARKMTTRTELEYHKALRGTNRLHHGGYVESETRSTLEN